MPVFLRTAYNYDMDQASIDSGLACLDDTLAQQQFKDECDINVIVDRFGITGKMPTNLYSPMQGDFTEVLDYRGALDLIREADRSFMELPAATRASFENDPQQFLDFVSDPANADKLADYGLTNPPKRAPEPVLVTIQGSPPPAPGA